MQLVTIDSREVAGRPGVMTASGDILDLVSAPSTLDESQWIPHSVVSVLAAGEDGKEHVVRLLEASAAADQQSLRDAGVLLPFDQTRLMAPVRRPGLVLVTERDQAGAGEPDPVAYIKSPNTVVGHSAQVSIPWGTADGLLVRPLLGIVLSRPIHRATEAVAARAIAAYSLLFDLSRPHPASGQPAAVWRSYLDSKQFPGACPVGPGLITADEFSDSAKLEFSMNGVAVNNSVCELSSLPALLAGLSSRYAFRPGDVVGVDIGLAQAEQRRYQDGDELTLDLVGKMRLETRLQI